MRDAEVQLSAQRLRELMQWHGKDERNLPPPETLVNLSRDTVAALAQLQATRDELERLRMELSQLFWSTDSAAVRRALLMALGNPPEGAPLTQEVSTLNWEAVPNGLDMRDRLPTATAVDVKG